MELATNKRGAAGYGLVMTSSSRLSTQLFSHQLKELTVASTSFPRVYLKPLCTICLCKCLPGWKLKCLCVLLLQVSYQPGCQCRSREQWRWDTSGHCWRRGNGGAPAEWDQQTRYSIVQTSWTLTAGPYWTPEPSFSPRTTLIKMCYTVLVS